MASASTTAYKLHVKTFFSVDTLYVNPLFYMFFNKLRDLEVLVFFICNFTGLQIGKLDLQCIN